MITPKYPIWIPNGAMGNFHVRFFKFLNKVDAPKMASGNLLFRHLNYYVQLELRQGDTFIGDKFEGRSLNDVRSLTYDRNASPAMQADMATLGIHMLEGGSVHFHNSTIALNEHAFILCFAYGEYSDLMDSMENGAGYSGAVEILNVMEFVSQIHNNTYLDDMPIKKLFHIECGEVRYEDVAPHIIEGNGILRRPDPFLKDRKYATQKEVRIVLKPFQSLPEKYLRADTIFLRMSSPEMALKNLTV